MKHGFEAMKIKIIISFIATVGMLGLTGCKPKETTLSGQIFIVTRGSENIKLGLVEVQLIEKQQVTNFLKIRQPEIHAQMLTLASELAELAKKSQNDYEKLGKLLSESQSEEEKARITKVMEENTTALKDSLATLKSLPSEVMYFDTFSPSILQKSTTDADGKFDFKYSPGKALTLFAKAKRTVGEETERYYWLVNAPSVIGQSKILLSNNNLVLSDPDGFFTNKAQPKAQQ